MVLFVGAKKTDRVCLLAFVLCCWREMGFEYFNNRLISALKRFQQIFFSSIACTSYQQIYLGATWDFVLKVLFDSL